MSRPIKLKMLNKKLARATEYILISPHKSHKHGPAPKSMTLPHVITYNFL